MVLKLKANKFIKKIYSKLSGFLRAYFPYTRAKVAYYFAYGEKANLTQPKTFSEKLLWLSLNTYRSNPLILQLSDKYLVRKYVKERIGEGILNELYSVWGSTDNINIQDLPNSFALKLSQGWSTNLICERKNDIDQKVLNKILEKWNSGQYLYDKIIADVGGISVKELKKYIICEKYLRQESEEAPIDYKFYCFNGVPKAILVIRDRFNKKQGVFMTTSWELLSELKGAYEIPEKPFIKPRSLERMVETARKLCAPFPFVRVDLYDINDMPIFGELTFFPSGCIGVSETKVDGKSMGELLDISKEMDEVNKSSNV